MKHIFKPSIQTLGEIQGVYTLNTVKNEPMLFGADLEFARKYGGPLTQLFLDAIEENLEGNVVIDSRVTMTMPGQYPSIPGWHCDDVPRKNQPILEKIDSTVQHFMTVISTSPLVSCTQFVTGEHEIDIHKNAVWNSVDSFLQNKNFPTRSIAPGEIIRFDQNTLHRAMPCKQKGWRFFIRASITHRKPSNEIRRQVQVYVPQEAGW